MKVTLFCLALFTGITSFSSAQVPIIVRTTDKHKRIDTILVYNPYNKAFSTSRSGADTFRACPANEAIAVDDVWRMGASDCTQFDGNIYDQIVSPVCPGIYTYIREHLHSPKEGACKGKHGLVVVEFKLLANGKVADPFIYKSLCPSIDSTAISIMADMPGWWVTEKEVRFRYRLLMRVD